MLTRVSQPKTFSSALQTSSRGAATSLRSLSAASARLSSKSSTYSSTSTATSRLTRTSPVVLQQRNFSVSSKMSAGSSNRPPPDQVFVDIANYVHDYKVDSELAWATAAWCLQDTLGCGLEALRTSEQCKRLMGPVVPGTVVPQGSRVPGTNHVLDPVRAAFNIGTQIRWLDFNDTWLAAEWGHPSDNLGAILAVADYQNRNGTPLKVKDVLEAMIKAHEIQGCFALENSWNRIGIDHVLLVKLASGAVVSKMLGLTKEQTIDVISHVFIDNGSLRTYRHAPNTGPRKSWAAGDACMKAVNMALLVKSGEIGYPAALTTPVWGYYDAAFGGNEFKFQRPYGSYVMENVLFKISFPAEFHAQTAVECAMILHDRLREQGRSTDDIASIRLRTQEAAMRIINKKGKLHNFADRDHDINYMIAVPLIYGRLGTEDYTDEVASDPRIDDLRAKIQAEEDPHFTQDYFEPESRSIGNALTVTLKDGTVLDEVEIKYPIGHKSRRNEGIPVLEKKFQRHIAPHYPMSTTAQITDLFADRGKLESMDVSSFVDLFVKE